MRTAHPVYLYSPGGAFIQAPDGRPLLMQVGYVGTPTTATSNPAATAAADGPGVAIGNPPATARAEPVFVARK